MGAWLILAAAGSAAQRPTTLVSPVLQFGHHGLVKELAFSPDEKTLASASWDGSIRIWDWPSGRLLRTFAGGGKTAVSVAFQPKGRLIASADAAGVILWDPRSGGHTDSVRIPDAQQIAFTPDGTAIAVASLHGIYLWRPGSARDPVLLSDEDARAIAVSPDGKYAASGNADSTVQIFDLGALKLTRTIQADEAWIWSVAFLPDSTQLASGSINGVRIWDLPSGRQLAQLGDRSYVWHISIDSQARLLSYTSDKPCLWDLKARTRIRCYDLSGEDFGAGVISPSGSLAAFSSPVPTVLQLSTGKKLNGSESAGLSEIAAFSPDGKQLYTSDASGSRLIDLTTGTTRWSLVDERSYDTNGFAFAARANLLVQQHIEQHAISLIDTADGREISRLHPAGLDLTMLAFIGNSHQLVAGSKQGEIVTYDLDLRREMARRKIGAAVAVVTSRRTANEFLTGDESGK